MNKRAKRASIGNSKLRSVYWRSSIDSYQLSGLFPWVKVTNYRYRVEARIVTWRGDNVLQVPTGALFRRGNDWMTFAVR